ncbi:MAG: hypothetical protein BWX56_00771 [Euryarchaeota archaeon ADurb.Bin023]|jgi:hypothetical protein|nr:DUF434 domain-containing protein [Methanofastidiosum sp.]OQC51751.1 MAG: hypothetical protein BWX56_00771 [Euryarchaeota archaeon ADurb.Bin023]HNV93947.1 DUF434 domain-containing protein [Methanofastidiosum sp.]HNZ60213.1 DUF434 domain-containing protein [Methanofastidiosum sp.]HOE93560.1 DUF434 domain-containing protein [Methanofastidiosum sp.]
MKKNGIDSAKEDLYLLLNKGYPKQYALRFVGDHYGLKNEQRYVLSRSVFDKSYIEATKKKKMNLKGIKGNYLFVDGYNVIITTESLLLGKTFVSMDGLLRDTRNVSNKHKITSETLESIDIILALLNRYPPCYTQFYLDKMMSKSGKLSELIRNKMDEKNINGDSETLTSVDHALKNCNGIVATNDSVIISSIKKFIDIPSKIKISR